MPKMKPNSGASKRFKVTANGKIKMGHAYKSHILTKKSTKQKRALTQTGYVDKADLGNVRRLLGIGK